MVVTVEVGMSDTVQKGEKLSGRGNVRGNMSRKNMQGGNVWIPELQFLLPHLTVEWNSRNRLLEPPLSAIYTGSQFTAYGKLSGIELCGVSWPHNKATGEHARLLARDILRVTELSAQTLLHIQQAARYGERDPVSHSLFPMSATIAKALSKTVDSLAFFASTKFWFVFPVGCLPEVPPGDYPPKTQTITLTFTLS